MISPEDVLRLPVARQLCEYCDGQLNDRGAPPTASYELYGEVVWASLSLAPLRGRMSLAPTPGPALSTTAAIISRSLGAQPFSIRSPGPRQAWTSLAGEDLDPARYREVQNSRLIGYKARGGLWTSTVFPTGGSGFWPLVESGYMGPAAHAKTTEFATPPGARLAVVTDAEDWRALCERFPRVCAGTLDVDWQRAAGSIDGVSLSALGVLCAQYVPVSRDGLTSVLTGWDTESTFWLRSPTGRMPARRDR
jgi:hypothetical protein